METEGGQLEDGCNGMWLHAVKNGYRLDVTLSSKILSMVLLMAAEIEWELISQHKKVVSARRKAVGKQLGRPKGSYDVSKLDRLRMRFGNCYRMVWLRLRLLGCMEAAGKRCMRGCGGMIPRR